MKKHGEAARNKHRFRKRLGANLRRIRRSKHVRQNELAKAVGLQQAALSRVEKGARGFTAEALWRAAGYLDCTMEELIGDNPTKTQHLTYKHNNRR